MPRAICILHRIGRCSGAPNARGCAASPANHVRMRAPFPRPPPQRAVLLLLAVSLAGAACKPSPGTRAPQRMLVDDIDAIEAELARNRSQLESAGIMVARATPTTPGSTTVDVDASGAAPPRDFQGGDAATEEEDIDDDADAAAPSVEPSPPAPPPQEVEAISDRSSNFRQRVARKDERNESSRCERICDLADATCDLAQNVCNLASRHPGESRYETACVRAEDQCRAASIACTRCE